MTDEENYDDWFIEPEEDECSVNEFDDAMTDELNQHLFDEE